MPKDIAKTVNEGVKELCGNTSGLCTDSPYIAVKAVYPGLCRMPHMPISGSSGFDLYKEIGGRQFYLGAYIPSMDTQTEYEGIVYTGNATGEPVNYVLNFPPYNALSKLYIGLKEGSCAETPNGYHNRKPVVFYGSSIHTGRLRIQTRQHLLEFSFPCVEHGLYFTWVFWQRTRRKDDSKLYGGFGNSCFCCGL